MSSEPYLRVLEFFGIPILALIFAWVGITLQKRKEQDATSWPITEGNVQFVRVQVGEGRDILKHAIVSYSYYLDQYESGEYSRSFVSEQAAYEFANALRDKRVLVHYNPRKHADSTLIREELEGLLQVRNENSFNR